MTLITYRWKINCPNDLKTNRKSFYLQVTETLDAKSVDFFIDLFIYFRFRKKDLDIFSTKTEFHFVLNQSEKFNYNSNSV